MPRVCAAPPWIDSSPSRSASRSSGVSTSSASEGTSTISAVVPSAWAFAACRWRLPGRTPASASPAESAAARWFRSRGGRGRSAPSARPRRGRSARRAGRGPSSGSRLQPAGPGRPRTRAPSLSPRRAAGLWPCSSSSRTIAPYPPAICWAPLSAVTTRTSIDRAGAPEGHEHVGEHRLGECPPAAGAHLVRQALLCFAEALDREDRERSHLSGNLSRARAANCSVSRRHRAPASRAVHQHVGLEHRRARRSVVRDEPVEQTAVRGRDPAAGRRPAAPLHERRRRSLHTSPPTSGLTATTGAGLLAIAARMPPHRQDRPDRDHRVGRTDHDRPCALRSRPAPRGGQAATVLRGSRSSRPGPPPRPLIMNS